MDEKDNLLLNLFIETIRDRYKDSLDNKDPYANTPEHFDYYFGSAAGFYDSLYTIETILKEEGCATKDILTDITPDLRLLVPQAKK